MNTYTIGRNSFKDMQEIAEYIPVLEAKLGVRDYGYLPKYSYYWDKPTLTNPALSYPMSNKTSCAKENTMEVKKTTVEFKTVHVPVHGEVKATQNANHQWVVEGLRDKDSKTVTLMALSRDGLKAVHALIQNLLIEGEK